MGHNCELLDLENQNIPDISQVTASGSLRVLHQVSGHCSVDLKLGNSGDLKENSVEKFKDLGDSLMELSSSGPLKRAWAPGNGTQAPSCLVDGCTADLSKCRDYHRRHKVCELHSKTPKVFIKGQEQRFCQQCSRFHPLVEFDEGKRSCRKRLDGHNRRRRKTQPDPFSVNSARFISNHQGTSYLQFGSSQIFSTKAASSVWTGAVKAENDLMPYSRQSPLNFSGTKALFPGALSHSYKEGKEFTFLQGTSSTPPGDFVGQPHDAASSILGNGSSSQNMLSHGLNRVISTNCALSLLSSPLAETRDLGSSHMLQHDLNPSAQFLIPRINYNGLGMESQPLESVLLMNSNANLHGQHMFQTEPDGSSASGSYQTLSFS